MGNPLRPVILRQPRAAVSIRLVDELTVCIREHRESARVHSLRHPEFLHRTQHVPRARDVDPLSLRRVLRPNLVPARDVEHPIDARHRFSHSPNASTFIGHEGLTTHQGCSMGETLTHKLIRSHLAEGATHPGEEIAIRMDQALLQDATGTLAWLEFEQMGQDRVAIRHATQYVDHNILQTGYENADDHRFLRSVCQRYGALFSGPGNGISHWAHMERFDMPGETMLGCDSHTPHAGACGMLAIGAGGFEAASIIAGEPYRLTMPEVVNVKLTGTFKRWVSAKDVILELLHRFDVKWAKNKVLEYTGPALKELTVPSRGTIANMGTELGATASVFPADGMTKQFLTAQARGKDFKPLAADNAAEYNDTVDMDLGTIEPLIVP